MTEASFSRLQIYVGANLTLCPVAFLWTVTVIVDDSAR
jgi:hypothetical protein